MKVAIVEGVRPTLMPEGPLIERKVLGPKVKIKWHGLIKPQDYRPALNDVDAVIARPGTSFSGEMISALKNAKVIVSIGVGYDHIDLKAASKRKIPVCNVPDYGTEEVADTTIAMILAHQRKIFLYNYLAADGKDDWDWRIHVPALRTNQVAAGIIGLGRIGTAVALRLKPFGFRISFYDPYVARGIEKSLGIARAKSLKELVNSSDVVTLHTPLTDETCGMVDNRFFESLKPQVILVNTARGGLFKNADIVERYLKKMPQLRIGSDVWPDEPPKDHPLLEAWRRRDKWLGDRLILTPHSAFYSEKAREEIRAFAAKIVKVVLDGGKPYNVVNGVDT